MPQPTKYCWNHFKPKVINLKGKDVTVVAERINRGATEYLRQGSENHCHQNPLSNYIVRP